MTYFNNAGTLEELRKQYKELLKIHHPDNGGNVSDMQEINAEYDKLFKVLEDKHDTAHQEKTDSAESDYSKNMYDWENDKALREVLEKIINFDGIEIEIIGQWIWCFNSKEYKEELKDLGFKYAPKKYAWYFHTETFRKKSHKVISLDDSRKYYGSTKFKTNQRELLEA